MSDPGDPTTPPPTQPIRPAWPTYAPPPAPAPTYAYPVAQPPGYPGQLRDHPSSTTALILGITSLVGFFTCFVTIALGPAAWYLGAKARREIDAQPEVYSGRGLAVAGMVMGIVATGLLVLGLVGVGALVLVLTAGGPSHL